MFLFMQKLLEFSMKLTMSRNRALRRMGKILAAIPVGCSEHLQKRLFSGKWDPGRKWRRRCRRKRRRSLKRRL